MLDKLVIKMAPIVKATPYGAVYKLQLAVGHRHGHLCWPPS
jgi:hypothetical protein